MTLAWEQVVGTTTYATPTWPLVVGLVGLAATLAAAVATAVLAWRWAKRGPWLAAPALVFVGALAQLTLTAPGIAWATVAEGAVEPWSAAGATLPWRVFGPLFLGELAVASVAGILLALAVALPLTRRPPGGRWRHLAPAWIALGLAWLLAQAGPVHAAWVVSLGRLPSLAVDGPAVMHAGRTRTVHTRLDGAHAPEAWLLPESPVIAPATPGTVEIDLEASRGPVRATAMGSIYAGEERADPALPLRVGNRWVWERTTSGRDHFLWGILSSRSESTALAGSLTATGTAERDGLRVFTLSWEAPGHDPVPWEVYALDGETRIVAASGDAPLIHHLGARGDLVDACTLAPLGSHACECAPPAHSERPVPGPTWCTWREESTEGAIGAGIAAVLTVGLVIPSASSDVSVDLVRSEAGPPDAPASP